MAVLHTPIPEWAQEYTADAQRAAEHAGVEVRLLNGIDEAEAGCALFERIWQGPRGGPLSSELCHALAHSGNYVAGAFAGDELLGAIAGFLGRSEHKLHLHSHVAAVLPEARGRAIGVALKLHQRAWAVGEGLRVIEWTFDPLVRANAHLNLIKLGAMPVTYVRNFYGHRVDGVNDGSDTDRLLVVWDLGRDTPLEAGMRRPEPSPNSNGVAAMVWEGVDGRPVTSRAPAGTTVRLVGVPRDIVALRQRDPELAREWRTAVRDAFEAAWAERFVPRGFTRSGSYVLTRGDD